MRWVLWLLIAAWLFFLGALAALHWVIVPRIGELRPELEIRASQALGMPLRIGSIAARPGGIFPSFALENVRLLDPDGHDALNLPRVMATVSPGSLWNLGFEHLYIDSPQLHIRRNAQGRIYVAGLDVSKDQDSDGRATDWFLSQEEFVIQNGSVAWTDEMRDLPTLTLERVNLVMRNDLRAHEMRLDANPPLELGSRFTIKAKFSQPLLQSHAGQWREWSGQVFAEFDRVDVAQLRRHANLTLGHASGQGAVRAWVDVARGQLRGATADVALSNASLSLGHDLDQLAMSYFSGRFSGKRVGQGFAFATADMAFDTEDGLHWPGGNVSGVWQPGQDDEPESGEFKANRLDLSALAQIAKRLPLDARVHQALMSYAPKGLVEQLQATWQGTPEALSKFEVKARVQQLSVAAKAAQVREPVNKALSPVTQPRPALGRPGVQGANVDVTLNQSGGQATVFMHNGLVEFPGVFEKPVIELSQLAAEVKWQITDDALSVQVPKFKFSNADAQGEAQATWHTSEPGPGVMDMQGTLSRANAARIYRYLPVHIRQDVRDYLRDALTAGYVSGVNFKVTGNLADMPFADSEKGEFSVSGLASDVAYAYVPRSLQSKDALPWPALSQAQGDFKIHNNGLALKNVHARIAGANSVQLLHGSATLTDMAQDPRVQVSLDAQGPLNDMLRAGVSGSPVGVMLGQTLTQSRATGNAELQLKLELPLAAMENTKVQGKVKLLSNEVQLSKDLPWLSRATGVVHFSEQGFALADGAARAVGGEVRAEGGSMAIPGKQVAGAAPMMRIQGTLTAEGVRQARELGVLSQLAQQANGKASYTASLNWRRGIPEWSVSSSLQGLSLNLPPPVAKRAESVLPLRIETTPMREPRQDLLSLDIGRAVVVRYMRDLSGPDAKVLRGSVAVGLPAGEALALPNQGVVAKAMFNRLDVDAMRNLLGRSSSSQTPVMNSSGDAMRSYLPTTVVLQADEVIAGGHPFSHLVAGATRTGRAWQANVDATELSGYVEYTESTDARAGRVYARLARLMLASSGASEVENLLDEQAVSIPTLDVVIDELELRGKKLGRLEMEAVNRGSASRDAGAREWRLNKLNVISREASFIATGNWSVINEAGTATRTTSARVGRERRRTVMNFKLNVDDAGGLLARIGMKDVFRRGNGFLEGQVNWLGSPMALDYPSLSGAFNVNIENGQFLKADPGAAKLLGVLNLQALPRRLTLDFRDVFSEGFSFDFVRGDVRIDQGLASTQNLQMKGVNAAVFMEGRADIARETQDIKVVVVPEINAGTASLIAGWANPIVGLSTFLAQLILRKPLIESNTQEFKLTGTWTDPKIDRIDLSKETTTPSKP